MTNNQIKEALNSSAILMKLLAGGHRTPSEVEGRLLHWASRLELAVHELSSRDDASRALISNFDKWRSVVENKVDLCIAGNPAVNGVCGDPECVCYTTPVDILSENPAIIRMAEKAGGVFTSIDPVEIEREKERIFGACGGACGDPPCVAWNEAHRSE